MSKEVGDFVKFLWLYKPQNGVKPEKRVGFCRTTFSTHISRKHLLSVLQFRFSKKATKMTNASSWYVYLVKCQKKWEISLNFCGFISLKMELNPKKGSGLAALQFQPTFLENICWVTLLKILLLCTVSIQERVLIAQVRCIENNFWDFATFTRFEN